MLGLKLNHVSKRGHRSCLHSPHPLFCISLVPVWALLGIHSWFRKWRFGLLWFYSDDMYSCDGFVQRLEYWYSFYIYHSMEMITFLHGTSTINSSNDIMEMEILCIRGCDFTWDKLVQCFIYTYTYTYIHTIYIYIYICLCIFIMMSLNPLSLRPLIWLTRVANFSAWVGFSPFSAVEKFEFWKWPKEGHISPNFRW